MASRDLVVRVIGDSRSVERAFARSTNAATKFDRSVTGSIGRVDAAFTKLERVRTGAFLGGAAAAAGIAAIKRTTDAASDLNEQISKSRQVFGQSSDAVEKWSRTTAKSIGVSQTAALEATGTFGNLFDAIGVGGPQAAETSKRLVQLAADLASFNNADPSEVLNAIRSGLVGEAEPLRRFGVLLSEARVQQVALAQTGKDNVKTLTDQEKALARVSIIFKDTSNAQGDFARTSESLANQQRILAANVADLEANLGRLLLPAVTKITGALSDATDAALALTTALSKLGSVRIPEIKIPIVGLEVPGTGQSIADTVGDILADALDPKKIALRALPGGQIALTLEKLGLLDGLFDTDEMKREVDAEAQKAIDQVFAGFKFPAPKTVNPADFAKLPGVDFDRAGLITGAVDDVIAGSRKALAEATRKVKAGLKTKALEDALDERRDAFSNLIASLRLGVDRAELTSGLQDDLDRLRDLKTGLQKQIKAGVDVTAAQSQLVGVTAEIASKQKEIAANAGDIAQARQFRALGLSATGDEIVPGIKNLQTRIDAALKQISSGQIDVPRKLVDRLKFARKLIRTEGKALTEETRDTINDFIKAATGAADKVTRGPLTKTTALNASKILDGLGLGRDMERELRARLSRFNSAGLALAGAGRAPTGGFRGGIVTQPIVVNTTVDLDGQTVARNTTKHQVKTGRGTRQKRGPNRRSGI